MQLLLLLGKEFLRGERKREKKQQETGGCTDCNFPVRVLKCLQIQRLQKSIRILTQEKFYIEQKYFYKRKCYDCDIQNFCM